ncbi:MAG: transcription-repair coupling factor, partial [Alphaproteobacteria bacterium]|nr:transcription-repair coupling factor [Alphaproteobacteria bacterium]
RLRKIAPEIKIVAAHGQMPASQLEKIMTDFAEQKYDVLLATSIIESGLDMPWVNTMIVHRADNFGLAGLYQLRGRVGRGKVKAYTYLTVEPNKRLSLTAQKRLSIMQSLDSLGAGFTLASHDLDIRGAGNLLGHEQSGHIKEVGVELYQRMLEEAVASLKAQNGEDTPVVHDWSPQISLGFSVLLPEKYITDLGVRMSLYNRLAHFESNEDIDAFREEITDRFGPIPSEAENLFASMHIKILCRQAFVERLEAGPKGMSISFYKNLFPNPAGLVQFITAQMGLAKLKPDKVIFTRPWADRTDRLHGIISVLEKLAKIAKE